MTILNSQLNLCVFSIIIVFLLSESKHISLLTVFPGAKWEIDTTLIDDIWTASVQDLLWLYLTRVVDIFVQG